VRQVRDVQKVDVPLPVEYAPVFERYVARVRHVADPIAELSVQRERVVTRLSPLNEEQAQYRYAPDKWSVKDLLGHLCDAERIFAYRLLRIGRGDATPLPGFEERDYARAASAHRRPFRDLLAEWSVVRDATSSLAASLPDTSWSNQGTSNDAPTTARALLYMILGHTEHHLAVLGDRYGV
jgi:uncharacterized damage-inducible protein DinB